MTDVTDPESFEEGRYLYCAVRTDTERSMPIDGIEGGSVDVLTRHGIGLVVQPVDSLFDSDGLTAVRRWLLSHHRVVDAASELFGTPVPFRFDTAITGGDAEVYDWLDGRRDELGGALDAVAGYGEYRIELEWDEAAARREVVAENGELADLESRIEDTGDGTGHLLEKRYERRIGERLADRRATLAETLYERVDDRVKTIEALDGRSTLLAAGSDGSAGETEGARDVVASLSILADESDEEAIGDVLREFAADPELSVTYTGPWPPYTHVPAIGEERQ